MSRPSLPISKELLGRWIEALRSPDAPGQISGMLSRRSAVGKQCFCALGILGRVAGWNPLALRPQCSMIYPELHALAKFDYTTDWRDFEDLVEGWNDEDLLSFPEIADRLEKMYGGKEG